MSRNITPRPVRAQGARDAHGRILGRGAGALYVHLHREAGLAHRHYVLRPWQVRLLSIFTSWPMIALYVIGIASWGWLASQAARVPVLQLQVNSLTADARRLDTLTATLTELQERYDHVQRLLSTASSGSATRETGRATSGGSTVTRPSGATSAPSDSSGVRPSGTVAPPRQASDTARALSAADSAARQKAAADSAAKRKAIIDTSSGPTAVERPDA